MTISFWKDTAVRVVMTFAQVVLGLMGTGSVGITTLDWPQILNVAGAAALAALLTSLTSLRNIGTPTAQAPSQALPAVVGEPATPVDVTPVYESTPAV